MPHRSVRHRGSAEKAESVLEQYERIVLSERDFARFVEWIVNPPVPTRKLVEAAEEYKRHRSENPEGNW